MTLWIVWTLVVSVLLAVAGAAMERAAANAGAPRRFVWLAVMAATTLVPVVVALRPAPAAWSSSGRAFANGADLLRSADAWAARAWALASCVLLISLLRSLFALRSARSQWVESESDLGSVLIAQDAGPAVVGFLRPRIVIPAWALLLPGTSREMLLRHETEHVRAGDSLMVIASELVKVLFPWNAALWWMTRRLRLAIELDCDTRVILAGVSPREYGSLLLAVGERHATPLPLTASLAGSAPFLEARIDAITALRPRNPLLASTPVALVAVLALSAAERMPRPSSPIADAPALGASNCTLEALQDSRIVVASRMDPAELGAYASSSGQRARLLHFDAAPAHRCTLTALR